LRAGLQALRGAFDAVAAGSARRVLVVASDCRLPAPGSALETSLGDGAAAFLVADADAIATLEGAFAVADEIVDLWRGGGEAFVPAGEAGFVVQGGSAPRMEEAVAGLFERLGIGPADCARVALFAPDARSHGDAARKLRVPAERLQDPLFGRLGNAGAAYAPLLLAAALESAKPGERLVVAGYGDGAAATAPRTTAP